MSDPEQDRAQRAAHAWVRWAILSYQLPEPTDVDCEMCLQTKANVYHHPNGYDGDAAQDVMPVCNVCHRSIHPTPSRRGQIDTRTLGAVRRALRPPIPQNPVVEQLIKLHAAGYTYAELAQATGVTKQAMQQRIRRYQARWSADQRKIRWGQVKD